MSRLEKITNIVREQQIDALMITGGVNLRYATMFGGLEGIVIINKDGDGIVYTDSRYIEDAIRKISPLGYKVIELSGAYSSQEIVAKYMEEKGYHTIGYEDYALTVAEMNDYKATLNVEMIPVGNSLQKLREIKEPEEIECIRRAQKIAESALEKLLPDIRVGAYEDELFAKLKYYMMLGGSEEIAPGMIFASGSNTSMPEARPTHRAITAGSFVMLDYGAIYDGYYSDMTRTFAVGYATDEMKKVYDIVLQAQMAGISAFGFGKTGKEVDQASRSVIEDAGYGSYFGHGTGHSFGLEVHEYPMASRRCMQKFQYGNVCTIEPGIYLSEKFGVRIEDMVYLTEDGVCNLTAFPKELMILDKC